MPHKRQNSASLTSVAQLDACRSVASWTTYNEDRKSGGRQLARYLWNDRDQWWMEECGDIEKAAAEVSWLSNKMNHTLVPVWILGSHVTMWMSQNSHPIQNSVFSYLKWLVPLMNRNVEKSHWKHHLTIEIFLAFKKCSFSHCFVSGLFVQKRPVHYGLVGWGMHKNHHNQHRHHRCPHMAYPEQQSNVLLQTWKWIRGQYWRWIAWK